MPRSVSLSSPPSSPLSALSSRRSGSRASSSGTVTEPTTLDASAFPHILVAVLDVSAHSTLLAFRGTCRTICQYIDERLGRHLVFEQVQTAAWPPNHFRGTAARAAGLASDRAPHQSVGGTNLAILVTDPERKPIPALPLSTFDEITPRQTEILSLARVVTLRGLATPNAFTTLMPSIKAHTLLYRVRGYAGPLPPARVVVPTPPAAGLHPGQVNHTDPPLWSLGPACCDTLVLLVPLSHMAVGLMLHSNAHRHVITILTPNEVSLSALGFSCTDASIAVSTAGTSATPPTPSPFPSAPSSPVPWARPPAVPMPAPPVATAPMAPLQPLSHIINNIARTIGNTHHTIVGLELLSPTRLAFPAGVQVSADDLQRHVVRAVWQQAWRGDWYGPADEMERSVRDRIELISHTEYERRVGRDEYLLETQL